MLSERTKKVYEFTCLVMVLLFAILPVYAAFGPEEYGEVFKTFSIIEIDVIILCFVIGAILYISKSPDKSFKALADDLKKNLKN